MGLDSRDYYRPTGYRGFSFFPPIIKYLIFINVGVFFIQLIGQTFYVEAPITLEHFLMKFFALNQFSDGAIPVVVQGELRGWSSSFYPWQLITYQFMHGDFAHIFFNMFMLWMFGMEIENIMGSKKFLWFYLLCGVGAGLLQIIATPLLGGGFAPTIGASGAIYGVMIAFAMFFPDRYIMFYFFIPVKAKYLIAFFMVIEFISVTDASVVAHLAHIGGAITGVIYILLDKQKQISFRNTINNFKKSSSNPFASSNYRRPARKRGVNDFDVEEADFYDINDRKKEMEVTQEEIDKILDKISQSGYQNLTDHEKKVLFEASKKK